MNANGNGNPECCVTVASFEMKQREFNYHQHYAEMVHFASQITVKALLNGSIINSTTIFGISVNYQEKRSKNLGK